MSRSSTPQRAVPHGRRGPRALWVLLAATSALPLAACSTDVATIGRMSPGDDGDGGISVGGGAEVSSGVGSVASSSGGGGAEVSSGVGSVASSSGGGGAEVSSGAGSVASSSGGGGRCERRFEGRIRDFRSAERGGHPDFEAFEDHGESGRSGLVEARLGPDRKPVYRSNGTPDRITGPERFDEWFRDVPGVNIPVPYAAPVQVTERGFGIFSDGTFFPIDGEGWDAESRDDARHNYGFTYELHMTFAYQPGDFLVFASDDDLWVFINDRLVVDLGGVHEPDGITLMLDDVARKLELEIGQEYPLDVFHAERRSPTSALSFSTLLSFTNCDPIVIPG
ncbi:fibro-slime domain-containing protein [Sorangium sp. So ce233]|uniref:fibro-slime domain-containing protein n=1 Tax=Sorangium sp. So ce233 TaxID=3133290 RepID=UPI003F5EF7C0